MTNPTPPVSRVSQRLSIKSPGQHQRTLNELMTPSDDPYFLQAISTPKQSFQFKGFQDISRIIKDDSSSTKSLFKSFNHNIQLWSPNKFNEKLRREHLEKDHQRGSFLRQSSQSLFCASKSLICLFFRFSSGRVHE